MNDQQTTMPETPPNLRALARAVANHDEASRHAIAKSLQPLKDALGVTGENPKRDDRLLAAAAVAASADDDAGALAVLQKAATDSLVARTDWTGVPPPREWLIPEWLAAGRVALLTGRAGRGKSWLTAHLAAAVAAGRSCWLPTAQTLPGQDTPAPAPCLVEAEPTAAVLASWEDEADELHRRLLSIGRDDIGDRLHHLDMAGRGPLWTEDTNTAVGEALREHCEKHLARLLVVDPLAGAFAGDEIARASVRYFMSDWDAWARRTKCTVVMVGHPPKSDDDYSGSTDWLAAARGLLVLSRVKQETNTKGKPTGRIVDDHHGEDLPGSVYRLAVRKSSYGRLPTDRLYLGRTDKGTWETAIAPKPEDSGGDTTKPTEHVTAAELAEIKREVGVDE